MFYQYHTLRQMTGVMLMQTNEKPESYIIGLVDEGLHVIIVQLLIIIVFAFKLLDHFSFYNIKGTKRIEGDFNLWKNYPVIFASVHLNRRMLLTKCCKGRLINIQMVILVVKYYLKKGTKI